MPNQNKMVFSSSHPLHFFFTANPVVVAKSSVRLRKSTWNNKTEVKVAQQKGGSLIKVKREMCKVKDEKEHQMFSKKIKNEVR